MQCKLSENPLLVPPEGGIKIVYECMINNIDDLEYLIKLSGDRRETAK